MQTLKTEAITNSIIAKAKHLEKRSEVQLSWQIEIDQTKVIYHYRLLKIVVFVWESSWAFFRPLGAWQGPYSIHWIGDSIFTVKTRLLYCLTRPAMMQHILINFHFTTTFQFTKLLPKHGKSLYLSVVTKISKYFSRDCEKINGVCSTTF